MLNEKKPLKLLPSGARKSRIYEMYPRQSDHHLRKVMHYIQIENNPRLDPKKAVHRQILTPKEFRQLVEEIGMPDGYENKFKD